MDMTDSTPSSPSSRGKRRGRPRTDPASSETSHKLIRTGLVYLTEKGYSATALDEILTSAEVPKGSFYNLFTSKEAFGLRLIDAYHGYFIDKLERALRNPSFTPLNRLRSFTRDAESGMARHEFRRGCLVGNLGQEMGAVPETFRNRLIDVLEDWQRRTADCLRLAQTAGEISPSLDPDALSRFFWTGWEGAVLRAKMERSPLPLRHFTATFFDLLTR